ncbi:2-oxoisovalerate dehydrogenase subunit beta [Enhygromyxa salina]|uniref:3-methyl-2-oxobutanoate dehydrogenase (2-methylpropanoyl-transferring) n=1 Tax=Enhygromyxa salina TaxID=215803 RepID=A0A2S9YG95_9BACT|nr:thiamine pyrophosphate-dependent enzyme [Enhygromyxa salina]PRQ04108.1 2-oxoisovalerate dehydrogenase subunit beta [Enhygromyxa salina]
MAAKYPLNRLEHHPTLTPELLRLAYREMCMARCHVERVVQECSKGNIKFAIWGPGEELHGAAQAIAYSEVVNTDAFGISGHYRSAGLLSMWARLRGYDDFHLDHMRQQLSRVTDPWSGGRQMTAHFNDPRFNILPCQSALGMQLGKAVGYAHGMRKKGHDDGVVVAVIGDGSMAESDLHEGMTGASILDLPLLLCVTDNEIAISVKPEDGRGLRDLEAYAKAFGFEFFVANGNDFIEVYETTKAAATYCRDNQRPALVWVRELARLNGHSNAGVYNFVFEAHDCVNDFGEALVEQGILAPDDIITRNEESRGDYYKRHDFGRVGKAADDYIVETMRVAEDEPEPTPESVWDHIYDPYPEAVEPASVGRQTVISLNGAIRAAMRDILDHNPMTWLYGQDVAERGGVMQATKGLWERFPDQVRDAPINEPLILGAAMGFALHEGATAMPEIQFSDYSLNTLHWLVYMGNLLWQTNGTVRANVIARLPVEPLHGGAIYHSMCMEGFYGSIPGLTIVAPTTSRDCYGLLRSAADYSGPVVVFESKGLYRMTLGDAFPGEPSDPEEVKRLKRAIGMQGLIPDLPSDFRVPLGKAAVRREGRDLTIVTWGRCTLFTHEAIATLSERGIDVEMIDLRTIVPPDMDTVLASVRKTGRLLVVHEDRVFASIGREIQGHTIEAMAGSPVVTRVLGQDAVPGIPQNINLEHSIVVSPAKIVAAAEQTMAVELRRPAASASSGRAPTVSEPARTRVLWTPNRAFVG